MLCLDAMENQINQLILKDKECDEKEKEQNDLIEMVQRHNMWLGEIMRHNLVNQLQMYDMKQELHKV